MTSPKLVQMVGVTEVCGCVPLIPNRKEPRHQNYTFPRQAITNLELEKKTHTRRKVMYNKIECHKTRFCVQEYEIQVDKIIVFDQMNDCV